MTTQFNEADHPRGSGGQFATKAHSEQDVDLTAPAIDDDELTARLRNLTDVSEITDAELDHMLDQGPDQLESDDAAEVLREADWDEPNLILRNAALAFSNWHSGADSPYVIWDGEGDDSSPVTAVYVSTPLRNGMSMTGRCISVDDIPLDGVTTVGQARRDVLRDMLRYGAQQRMHVLAHAESSRKHAASIRQSNAHQAFEFERLSPEWNNAVRGAAFPACTQDDATRVGHNYETLGIVDENRQTQMGLREYVERRTAMLTYLIENGGSTRQEAIGRMTFPRVPDAIVAVELGRWRDATDKQRLAIAHRLTLLDQGL